MPPLGTSRPPQSLPSIYLGMAIVIASLSHIGCQKQSSPPTAKASATPKPPPAKPTVTTTPQPVNPKPTAKAAPQIAPQPASTFADLAVAARQTEFDLPKFDDEAITASGLRKFTGQHLTIYTDLPPAAEIDELPQVFDAAIPLWCGYFSIPHDKLNDWKLVASVMKDKSRFVTAGLYPASLPDFASGYNVGSQIWLYEQPSSYYRRHLLLHEGTHAFMLRWLGGAGPPWYMEGIAELLATHHWEKNELKLAVMPQTKTEVAYWGRIKMIKDDVAADRGLSLIDVMKYDAHAHLKVEAYAWCWTAAWFLSHHPLTKAAFADLQNNSRDRTLEFSKRFYETLKSDWPAITEDWQIFTNECDYGYDVPRAIVQRKDVNELPTDGAKMTVATDRGWQSTGFRLISGKKYVLKATGRYNVQTKPSEWPCEPGGITLHYHRGHPLGMLLAGLSELEQPTTEKTPLLVPQSIGSAAELTPTATGTLFLKINEASSGLADNSGSLNVQITELK